jgi:hypothetical protein
MNQVKGYIYIRNHSSYDFENVCKLGKTNNIPERDSVYVTNELKRGSFDHVYEIQFKLMDIVEKLLQYEFKNFNVKYNGGTEFFHKEIINLIEPTLIKFNIEYKKLSKLEIHDLGRSMRVKESFKKINIQSLINLLKSGNQFIWHERDYQKTIINECKNELLTNHKFYLELATGGGKSLIVYKLFSYLNSDFIIIISPRKVVNSQNVSQKYLQILKDDYITFNYSKDNDIKKFLESSKKRILICCTQSMNKIYDKIISHNISNITVWFDEAHWCIEESITNVNYQFWLYNTNIIKYRIFTSASPNKDKIFSNENIFGRLLCPIKISQLIRLNWLSPIKAYVYSENKKKY